ncbi:SulP family inorganic anion transporter [Glycomyces paridis]|nr:SulP family inorganic anion transporter [Glycomyces paridis]
MVRRDAVVALAGAVARVPDGMAAAVVVGVSPVHGIYAAMSGTIVGGLTSSTALMVVTTTTAAALAAESALSGVAEDDLLPSLFLVTVLAGLIMMGAGLLRLGRYTRFVSHSVMIGFLTGVAVNIALGQLGNLTGAPVEGANAVGKAWSVLTDPAAVYLPSLLTGTAAIALG